MDEQEKVPSLEILEGLLTLLGLEDKASIYSSTNS
jgi:hypothetical protein